MRRKLPKERGIAKIEKISEKILLKLIVQTIFVIDFRL
jgi:hypothetical protein